MRDGRFEEDGVSKHLVEAVDMAVSDVRLSTLIARWPTVPRGEARMRSCSGFNTLGESHWEVRVKVA